MPRPAPINPRAPAEACGRNFSSGRSARPRALRRRFSARARSAAVSARVPSKSKRTALLCTAERVVDVAVFAKAVLIRDWVVRHALQFERLESRVAAPARELRGFDEARVVVGAFGQHL